MGREVPKNVRQIGNVSDNPKIYVEDYVDTFFGQLSDKAEEEVIGAFLIGELGSGGEQDYIYIYGALQMHEVARDQDGLRIDEDTWKAAYEDCKRYFGDAQIIGWFLSAPGLPMEVSDELVEIHEAAFPETYSVFVMREPREQEESFYVNKFNDLMKIGGHYVYYEKNPAMQNYMIAARRRNGLTTSEWVEDGAAKSFRSLIRTKGELEGQRQSIHFAHIASSFLILVMLVMGVTMMNNYDKIRSVQRSLETIAESIDADLKGDLREEAKPASGQATADDRKETGQEKEKVEKKKDSIPGIGPKSESKDKPKSKNKSGTGKNKSSRAEGKTEIREGSDEDVYVVRKGDTLVSISKKIYGSDENIEAICEINGLQENDLIYIGQKLLLP